MQHKKAVAYRGCFKQINKIIVINKIFLKTCAQSKSATLQALILSAAQPSELRAWRLHSHEQRISWSMRIMAAFAAAAAAEDKKGVLHFPPQADCPDLATIMATLLSALQVLQVDHSSMCHADSRSCKLAAMLCIEKLQSILPDTQGHMCTSTKACCMPAYRYATE